MLESNPARHNKLRAEGSAPVITSFIAIYEVIGCPPIRQQRPISHNRLGGLGEYGPHYSDHSLQQIRPSANYFCFIFNLSISSINQILIARNLTYGITTLTQFLCAPFRSRLF